MANHSPAVLSEWSQLIFSAPSSPTAPRLPQSVVDQRGGRTEQAINKHSRVRFNFKVPRKMNHFGTNFPPRPSPIVIERPPTIVRYPRNGGEGPFPSAKSRKSDAVKHTSIESKMELFKSDRMALASWLAKRDLGSNRDVAISRLSQKEDDDNSDTDFTESDGDGDDDGDDDGDAIGDGDGEESVKAGNRIADRYRSDSNYDWNVAHQGRNSQSQTAKKSSKSAPKSVHFQSVTKPPRYLPAKKKPPQPFGLTGPANQDRPNIRLATSDVPPPGQLEEEEDEEYKHAREKNELSKLCQQLTGQLSAIEGVLRRRFEKDPILREEEDEIRRKRLRGEEQVTRSNRLVYNLRQQLQEVTGELDKHHSTSNNKFKKSQLVQRVTGLARGCCRVCQALVRAAALLAPGSGGSCYARQLAQLRETCGVVRQVLWAALELELASRPTVDRVLARVKSFEDVLNQMSCAHKEMVEDSLRAGKLGEKKGSTKSARPPSTNKKPPGLRTGFALTPTKNHGVILPPQFRRRMDRRMEKAAQVQDRSLDDHFTKETYSFWVKKQFQTMKNTQQQQQQQQQQHHHQQQQQQHQSLRYQAQKEDAIFNATLPDMYKESTPHHHQEGRLVPNRDTTSPSRPAGPHSTSTPSPPRPHSRPSAGGAPDPPRSRHGDHAAPLSAQSWDMLAKEITRQAEVDRQVLVKHSSNRTSKKEERSSQPTQQSLGRRRGKADEFVSEQGRPVSHKERQELSMEVGHREIEEQLEQEEVERRASHLLCRPTFEAMMLRLEEIENESDKLRLKWSTIAYEDPFATATTTTTTTVDSRSDSNRNDIPQNNNKNNNNNNSGVDVDIHVEPIIVMGGRGERVVALPIRDPSDTGEGVPHSCDLEGGSQLLEEGNPGFLNLPATGGTHPKPFSPSHSHMKSTAASHMSHSHWGSGQPSSIDSRVGYKRVSLPEERVRSIEEHRERFHRHRSLTCTGAVGDSDPANVIERVSEALLDDLLLELAGDTLGVCDEMAQHVFSDEFARPDSSVELSTLTAASPSVELSILTAASPSPSASTGLSARTVVVDQPEGSHSTGES